MDKKEEFELDRIKKELSEFITDVGINEWLKEPNDMFDGKVPHEMIENNDTEEIWKMIFKFNGVEFK